MTATGMLRSAAVATALVGLFDPSWTARRRRASVRRRQSRHRFRGGGGRRAPTPHEHLKSAVTFDSDADPVAIVVVGGTDAVTKLRRDDLPISTVAVVQPRAPNVRIVAADDPDSVRVGWAATFTAVVEARGLAGRTSRIVLEERGAELAHLEHQWTHESERFDAALRYTPPAIGTSIVTLRVVPFEGESTTTDNAVDLRLVARGQRLRVLVHEPRPSWNAAFVRRAIEQDPTFEVSTLVQASRGLAVRAGSPPAALYGRRAERLRRRARRRARRAERRPRSRRCGRSRAGGVGPWCSFRTGGRRGAIWTSRWCSSRDYSARPPSLATAPPPRRSCHHGPDASGPSGPGPRLPLRHRLEGGATPRALTELALRTGFRGIDTANQRRHYYEAGVGEAPRRRVPRGRRVARASCSCRRSSPTRTARTTACPTTRDADLATQVAQSFASSLEHLGTESLDSYVLHGPATGLDVDRRRLGGLAGDGAVERDAGRTRLLGVSNVTPRQLEALCGGGARQARPSSRTAATPASAGTARCARSAASTGIVYQGFSLLTANRAALSHAARAPASPRATARTPAQVVFRFALARRHAAAHRHHRPRPHGARTWRASTSRSPPTRYARSNRCRADGIAGR